MKINPLALYWWTESMGRFELQIPGQALEDIAQSGSNDAAVEYWAEKIERPVSATAKALRDSLREYGAWEDDELEDDATNWERVVWSAAWDLADGGQELEEAS